MPHSARWEQFEVPVRFLYLIGPDVAFPILSSLTLGPTSYAAAADAISPFTNAPLLKEVSLGSGFHPSRIQLPWSQLTSIRALGLSVNACINILQHSTAL
jgi:hypothetical protein